MGLAGSSEACLCPYPSAPMYTSLCYPLEALLPISGHVHGLLTPRQVSGFPKSLQVLWLNTSVVPQLVLRAVSQGSQSVTVTLPFKRLSAKKQQGAGEGHTQSVFMGTFSRNSSLAFLMPCLERVRRWAKKWLRNRV